MSSRSTSPIPPPSSSSGGGGGGILSNDVLYAPLSTYAECSTSTSHHDHDASLSTNDNYNNSTPTSNSKNKTMKKKQPIHSLSLQTSSSLRESSLLTFLTSMSTNLKTSHPHEYPFYRGIGGAVSKYGMGDTDRIAATKAGSIRSLLEGKLLNRSLVLVGGGVYNGNTAAAAAKSDKMSLVSSSSSCSTRSSVLQQAGASNSAGKRERKRVGGNGGLFGCISNKKRKKMLQKMKEDGRLLSKHDNRQSELKIRDGTEDMEDALSNEKEDNPLLMPQKERTTTRLVDTQQNIGKVIENLHQMWMGYMQQLLHAMAMAIPNNKDTTTPKQEVVLTLEHRKQVSLMLATSEHVGMAATITQCPSRRHLVNTRCIVVNETKETWKIAMIKIPKKKKPSQEGTDVVKEGGGNSASTKDGSGKCVASDGVWKIVMVPKRGTVLDVQLPLGAVKDRVTVRLES